MPPAASVPLDLYPPVSHDPRWWWLVAGCLLAAVAAMWGCRRVLAAIDSAAAGDGPVTLETVRAAALQDLEEAKDVSERGGLEFYVFESRSTKWASSALSFISCVVPPDRR